MNINFYKIIQQGQGDFILGRKRIPFTQANFKVQEGCAPICLKNQVVHVKRFRIVFGAHMNILNVLLK